MTVGEMAPTRDEIVLSDWLAGSADFWISGTPIMKEASAYWIDFFQRSILFADVLRERGNNYIERSTTKVPHVLEFDFDVVQRGDQLTRPVNYVLVQIRPPKGTATNPSLRPFIVFDPRAGHGPGIGGMKHDSEIGVVLAAGHPCYFVGFTPEPAPGQTVQDVCLAQSEFVRTVASRHPGAEGKPCVIANCQAGWQLMMMCAAEPGLVGPILVAGSPLSYWAGVKGKNPMRYTGGMLGGSWLTAWLSDLGAGFFDGANIIMNFEHLNPANTFFQKSYNLHSKIDAEPTRYLEFEKWWGQPVLFTGDEMQYIVDELFVGNRLTEGALFSEKGVRIDLRNIKSPIVVLCSEGDNITPPQQALGWIVDLYESTEDIVEDGQTIIYSIHDTVGHLGIFVSAKIAVKEHDEFTRAMDLIDVLPPGLYEAVISDITEDTASQSLISGQHLIRFEPRTIDNIRALGGNSAKDDRAFAAASRVSEVNEGLYCNLLSGLVSSAVTESSAEFGRRLHPLRVRYEMLSDENPSMQLVAQVAALVREHRRPVEKDNFFRRLEGHAADSIVKALDAYRDVRDQIIENAFFAIYGAPLLQACVGLQSPYAEAGVRAGRKLSHEVEASRAMAALDHAIEQGGLREAFVRSMLYVALGRGPIGADERGFAVLRAYRSSQPENRRTSIEQFKKVVRDQHQVLRLDSERSLAAIPAMIAAESESERAAAIALLRQVMSAVGEPNEEMGRRFARVEALFASAGAEAPAAVTRPTSLQAAAASGRRRAAPAKDLPQAKGASDGPTAAGV